MAIERYDFDPRDTSREERVSVIERLCQLEHVADISLENGYHFSGRIALFIDNSVWIQRWDPLNLKLSKELIIVELDDLRKIHIP